MFSASLRDVRPAWFLWPIMLFFSLLVLSFIPAIADLINIYRTAMPYNSPGQWQGSPLEAFIYAEGPGVVVPAAIPGFALLPA